MNAALDNKRYKHRRWVSPRWWTALRKGDRVMDTGGHERLLLIHPVQTGRWEGFIGVEPRTEQEKKISAEILEVRGHGIQWIGLELHEVAQPLSGKARELWEEDRV